MSTSAVNDVNTNKETIPLLNRDKHTPISIQSEPRNDTIQSESHEPGKENGKTASESVAPCAKYGDDNNRSTSPNTKRAKRKLTIACILCLFFLLTEFIGGYIYYHHHYHHPVT
jgi:hypothetical protein